MKEPKAQPMHGERAIVDQKAREEREAAALRANLRRRKEQMRARQQAEAPAPSTEQADEGD